MVFTIGVIAAPPNFISSGIRIIRSPTPASDVEVIGLATASADAPNARTKVIPLYAPGTSTRSRRRVSGLRSPHMRS
jgi:hypothetical protein